MKTQEMHEKFLANMIKLTGKTADELVPPIHKAGVEAHAAGDQPVNEARQKFFQAMADELGIEVERVSKYADDLKDDRPKALQDLIDETGKSKQEVLDAFHKAGPAHQEEYDNAVAANHEGFVVRAAKELGMDRSIIEKAFIFD
ncbi:MAG: hypothetical protein SPI12_06165 [Actinomycetaceae bacterium]|nr:hypothetical protein [Actinomycetaceae bacterium]MDY6083421.1 hypothetical protein [Actinomycetaceae bacterium]